CGHSPQLGRPRAVQEIVPDREVREEQGVLGNVPYFPLLKRYPRAVHPTQDDSRPRLDSGEGVEKSRFPAPARADQGERLRLERLGDFQGESRRAARPDLELKVHRSSSRRRACQRSRTRAASTETRQIARDATTSPTIRLSPPGLSSSA